MLEYDKINISGGIDINKCKETFKECSLCKFLSMDHIYVVIVIICL